MERAYRNNKMEDGEYRRKLTDVLYSYQLSGFLCDTTVELSDGQVSAHSLVLAAASSILQAAFNQCDDDDSDLSSRFRPRFKIQVPDCDSAAMNIAIYYIYTGRIDVPGGDGSLRSKLASRVAVTLDKLGVTMSGWRTHEAKSVEDIGLV